jgi:oligo-alginate lyase
VRFTTSFLYSISLAALLAFPSASVYARAGLLITGEGLKDIHQSLGNVPLFDMSVAMAKHAVDQEIERGIDTPQPLDYSGGYSHERHKQNFYSAQKAGALYLILQDDRYAAFVKDMLFKYEAMYKNLPIHPKTRSYARGKLFWQCLNDSNWLFYMAQAYDAIYEFLTPGERLILENNLFRPFADFISLENPQFYNRIHNHSAWGNAAVGMIGLAMRDELLVKRALYGIESNDRVDLMAKDNDGGLIYSPDGRAGFLANIDEPFSPEGYFTEGPYYQRYAMYPFLVFATALHNTMPNVNVLGYKEGVLIKAVDALLNLTDAEGDFFPLNDAQKGMSVANSSLISAVNIAYYYGTQNPALLSVAQQQGHVLLDQSGLSVAKAIRDGNAHPFKKNSVNFRDGSQGTQGGLAVLRAPSEKLTSVFKYSSHGLSHGHYDKLSFSLYGFGSEVLQDYGLVRFVNIEQKGGGNYLKENNSWAKQTVAHNTLVQDQRSHFKGVYEVSSQHAPVQLFFEATDPTIHAVSALDSNAYPGTLMHRTQAMIHLSEDTDPFLLDIFRVEAVENHQYDLPFHFMGQLIESSVAKTMPDHLEVLGQSDGYQHLFLEALGSPGKGSQQLTWLNEGFFYTLTTEALANDQWLFTRLGANDSEFNLRRDAALIIRRPNTADTIFASIIEQHGSYSPVTESSVNPFPRVSELQVLKNDQDITAVSFVHNKQRYMFILSNEGAENTRLKHTKINGVDYEWYGNFTLLPLL